MRREAGALVLLLALGACGRGDERVNRVRALSGGDPDQGKRAVVKYGCAGCHVIPEVREATGKVGPPLTSFSGRAFIAGKLPNTPENLVTFVKAPHGVRKESAMPETGVTPQDARDIAALLYSSQ